MDIISEEEQGTIQIPLTEYNSIKAMAAAISMQNQAIDDRQVEIARNLLIVADSIKSLLEHLGKQETLVIPAPEVRVEAANLKIPAPIIQSPPDVIVNIPMDKTRKLKMKVTRDRNGALAGFEGTIE